jgi:hypothetical protein
MQDAGYRRQRTEDGRQNTTSNCELMEGTRCKAQGEDTRCRIQDASERIRPFDPFDKLRASGMQATCPSCIMDLGSWISSCLEPCASLHSGY